MIPQSIHLSANLTSKISLGCMVPSQSQMLSLEMRCTNAIAQIVSYESGTKITEALNSLYNCKTVFYLTARSILHTYINKENPSSPLCRGSKRHIWSLTLNLCFFTQRHASTKQPHASTKGSHASTKGRHASACVQNPCRVRQGFKVVYHANSLKLYQTVRRPSRSCSCAKSISPLR